MFYCLMLYSLGVLSWRPLQSYLRSSGGIVWEVRSTGHYCDFFARVRCFSWLAIDRLVGLSPGISSKESPFPDELFFVTLVPGSQSHNYEHDFTEISQWPLLTNVNMLNKND